MKSKRIFLIGAFIIAGLIFLNWLICVTTPVFPIDESRLRGIMVYEGNPVSGHTYEISADDVSSVIAALNHLALEENKELSGYSYEGNLDVFEQRNAFTEKECYRIDMCQTTGLFSQKRITRIISICEDYKIVVQCLEQAGKEKYYTVYDNEYGDFLAAIDEIAERCVSSIV